MRHIKGRNNRRSSTKNDKKIAQEIIADTIISTIIPWMLVVLLEVFKVYFKENILWVEDINYKMITGRVGVLYSIGICFLLLLYIFNKYNVLEKSLRLKTIIIVIYLSIISIVNLILEYIEVGKSIKLVLFVLNFLGAFVLPYYSYVILKAIEAFNEDLDKEQAQSRHFLKLSYTDKLTGIPNRAYILSQIQTIINSGNHSQSKFAVLFLDLDGFKQVNDTFGHDVGDKVLKEVTKRFFKSIRTTDIIARFGGDEFVVLVVDIEDKLVLENICERIINEINEVMYIDNFKINVGVSIGVAIYPKDGINEEDLIKNADYALYEVKREGKNGYKFYS